MKTNIDAWVVDKPADAVGDSVGNGEAVDGSGPSVEVEREFPGKLITRAVM
jgi:hypothetical protein